MADAKVLHRVLRQLAAWAVWSFFTEVHVIGGENVPKDGPIIVTATHHNMMLDPAILSVAFPYARILHYWSKASLFANPAVSYILYSTGNIPVDRKSKDRQGLFKGTFEALAAGHAVALFPEGTSYTEPRIMQVKDGASWAAMEYMKWAQENPEKTKYPEVRIVPAAIVYTNKSKYRSNVILEFGQPISMEEYKEQFFSSEEGAPRAAVKRLTHTVEKKLFESTVNAPDWDTLYAARMARDLLWENEKYINLDDFVAISQTLVDIFCTSDATANFNSVKRYLLEYYSLLQSTHLTHSVLSNLPLPRSLDPKQPTPLPSRLATLFILAKDTLSALVRLPFFILPLLVHLPVYVIGRIGARLADDEEETRAQNKVVLGLLFLLGIYPAAFFFLWALLWYTPMGALLAFSAVWLFAVYHTKLINDNYEHARRVIAAWRVLMGVWAPKKWEFPIAALKEYTQPIVPKPNPWIDRPKTRPTTPSPVPNSSLMELNPEPPVHTKPVRRPPSRRIMRHVLRARAEAVRALASFFDQLDKEDGKRVRASSHLALLYGGWVDDESNVKTEGGSIVAEGKDQAGGEEEPRGWRSAREVMAFLKKRGAKFPSLGHTIEGDWAAMTDADSSMYESGAER